ncbi:MAG: NAD(P)/FAD-dependent oxidoreductase [Acidimicrobiales bacterium]
MTDIAEGSPTAVVVGGGPGGLMAAEVLASAGVRTTVFDHKRTVGRKLLLAGRSGLNLTNGEPVDDMLARLGPAAASLEPSLRRFGPDDLRLWSEGLGQSTFVGSSGRVFPDAMRATPLLRAWADRLDRLGVAVETRSRWLGWATHDDGRPDPRRLVVRPHDDEPAEVAADVSVFALGGASWPRVGSDGGWVGAFRDAGVHVADLRAANCGLLVRWSGTFADRFDRQPLKNVAVAACGMRERGDLMVTDDGLEGGPIYAVSGTVRDALRDGADATVSIDLRPDLDEQDLADRLSARRRKDSTSTWLRRAIGLPPVAVGILREATGNAIPSDPRRVAALVKASPLPVVGTMPIDRAISTAGGITLDQVDETFMLRRLPGTFVAGEMLDWEAPTGGYLLQVTFSTAVAAGLGALAWLDTPADQRPARTSS